METFPRTEESVVARSWAVLPNVDYANARPVGVTKKTRDGIQQWTSCFVQHNITLACFKNW